MDLEQRGQRWTRALDAARARTSADRACDPAGPGSPGPGRRGWRPPTPRPAPARSADRGLGSGAPAPGARHSEPRGDLGRPAAEHRAAHWRGTFQKSSLGSSSPEGEGPEDGQLVPRPSRERRPWAVGGGAAARALLRHVPCPSPAPSTRAPVLSRAPCLAGASLRALRPDPSPGSTPQARARRSRPLPPPPLTPAAGVGLTG